MAKLPDYLVSVGYHNPTDPEHALFHYALGTDMNMFQWLKKQPEQLEMFSAYNAAATEIQGPSLKAIILGLLLREKKFGSDKDQVLLVDVGAGSGQILSEVRRERQDLVGRIIAQDLPEVIERREVVEEVENMAVDFFQPQPVKGTSTHLTRN